MNNSVENASLLLQVKLIASNIQKIKSIQQKVIDSNQKCLLVNDNIFKSEMLYDLIGDTDKILNELDNYLLP